MPLKSAAELAAFAEAADGTVERARPAYLNLSAMLAWDAVIECAKDADAISWQRARQLKAIAWRKSFADFVAPTDQLILNATDMRAVPAGAFIAFIEVDEADAFHKAVARLSLSAPLGRRHIIHAMLSLGNGRAAGNKNSCVGIGDPVGWQVLDLAGSLNWRIEGVLDNVNAVPLGINKSRPIRLRWRALERYQTPDVIEPRVAADLARLRALSQGADPGSILALVLGDAVEASQRVKDPAGWSEVAGGGNAAALYDPATDRAATYRIQYVWGNLGSLVHELTHVMNNQDYRRDFANHATAKPESMPDPLYNALGVRSNEFDRQNEWFRAWPIPSREMVLADLLELFRLLQAVDASSELGQHKRVVEDKLLYGTSKVDIEHDTVLNQILIWIHVDWNLALAADAKAFVDELESACSRSRERRIAARSEQIDA